LQAVNAYGPRIELNKTAGLKDVSDWGAMRTSSNKGEVLQMLQELSDALLYFANRGTPVKLAGIGTFTPTINRHGERKITFRPDPSLQRGINNDDEFTATVANKASFGLSDSEYRGLWDAGHPDDPLEI